MNFEISHVHYDAEVREVKKGLAKVLHSSRFSKVHDSICASRYFKKKTPDYPPGNSSRAIRPHLLNFQVTLKPSEKTGYKNNGTGILTLPTQETGEAFLRLLRNRQLKIYIRQRQLYFQDLTKAPAQGVLEVLNKVVFQNPDIEAEREQLKEKLDALRLRISKISFGVIPFSNSSIFSQEWERDCNRGDFTSSGFLTMEWEHKLFRMILKLRTEDNEEIERSVVVRFSDIYKIFTGVDVFNPFIIFEMYSTPVFEEEYVHRTLTGKRFIDRNKFRKRIGSIDSAHEVVAPYTRHLCVVLHDGDNIESFIAACQEAKLRKPQYRNLSLEKRGYFQRRPLGQINRWHKEINSWQVSFQVEALLRNGTLNTEEIIQLLPEIHSYLQKNGTEATVAFLREFNSHISKQPRGDPPLSLFRDLSKLNSTHLLESRTRGNHMCYHVTVTPTRVFLEGPYPDQSNPVVNEFSSEYFLRVSFRDEDGQTYRWDREVDGNPFLRERVGGILNDGIDIAHYHFDFLAFSSSGLRSHSVWFMRAFDHPERGFVTVERLRIGLGDFSKIADQPSKVAARMGQRFTSTQRSALISADQWTVCQLKDLGVSFGRATLIENPDTYSGHMFTDGAGTMSPELGDIIHQCIFSGNPKDVVKPTTYQIRFLGFKGMIAIDESLRGQGIKLRLRPSMNKFKAHEETGYLEIAKAFYRPGRMHLNRQYIMILEDLGIPAQVFLNLQNKAIETVDSVKTNLTLFSKFLYDYHLGIAFRLSSIAERLAKHGMTLGGDENDESSKITFPFFIRLVAYSTTHVLREIKYKARIPVPNSYQLVGVPDEGMDWIARGKKNVRLLEEGEIYACVQEPGEEPKWLEGLCIISRSPTVHPGDIQRVKAIGKPPPDKVCAFANLVNCVVFNTRGRRPLPSFLGGGDLDGDLYDICMYQPMFPLAEFCSSPAEYAPVKARRLCDLEESDSDEGNSVNRKRIPRTQCNIKDIAKFVVEYIHSDVLGLLSVNHSVIADQSKEGVFDRRCIKLAELCSKAVEYPKSGWPVPVEDSPHRLIPYNPDWREGEVETPYKTYYESQRALGFLYRAISLEDPAATFESTRSGGPPILSMLVASLVQPFIEIPNHQPPRFSESVQKIFKCYSEEMKVIASTHTVKRDPTARLSEEEIVVGTILGSFANQRMRQDRVQRLRTHTGDLVKDIEIQLIGEVNKEEGREKVLEKLTKAWEAWVFGAFKRQFGASSFALIALGLIFDLVEKLDEGKKVQLDGLV